MSSSSSSSSIVQNTQQELKRAINSLLSFFKDDRGKNLLRSFSALSQNYIDLKAVCLHGSGTGTTTNSDHEKQCRSSSSNRDGVEQSIVFDPAVDKMVQVSKKIKSISERVDSILAASASLMNELLQLLNRVKELSHATFVAANNFIHSSSSASPSKTKEQSSSGTNVHLRLLKDVLENLVNDQLQNKIVTIHVIINEVTTAIKNGLMLNNNDNNRKDGGDSGQKTSSLQQWKLSVEQLRVYQTALTAEFNELTNAANGIVLNSNHPLDSISSLIERTGTLCTKICV